MTLPVHPSQHGARSVLSADGSKLDCGHQPRSGTAAFRYETGTVCERCAVLVWCPACSKAGRNVLLNEPRTHRDPWDR